MAGTSPAMTERGRGACPGMTTERQPLPLEIQGEAALDGVALRMRGELALVEGAELGPRRDAPVETGLHQRRVARDRDAGHRERRAGALERKRARRRHVAEG